MPLGNTPEEMEKFGWIKSVTYEKIMCDETTKDQPILEELDFFADDIVCGKCRKSDLTYVLIPDYQYTTGILAGCLRCRMVWGPLADENASAIRTKTISIDEAMKIIARTQKSQKIQIIPSALKKTWKKLEEDRMMGKKSGHRKAPPKFGE